MKTMTLRNIPDDLARELEREKTRRGESLNQLAIDLMKEALGLGQGGRRSNGLAELAGSWTAEDLAEFERATAPFEQVDEELWS
jgi:plasmid stability protein